MNRRLKVLGIAQAVCGALMAVAGFGAVALGSTRIEYFVAACGLALVVVGVLLLVVARRDQRRASAER